MRTASKLTLYIFGGLILLAFCVRKRDSVSGVATKAAVTQVAPKTTQVPTAATAPTPAVVDDSIRIPTDTRAEYYVLAKGENGRFLTLSTRRVGPSGVSFAKYRFDCKAHTSTYLGEGDTLQEMEKSKADPKMHELQEGSISDYWWHYACQK